jgi:hypothetical protein
MGTYPPPPPGGPGSSGRRGGFAERIDEAIELMELELRHAVTYFNDAVVPQVRRESIVALRSVSDKLRALADRLDPQSGRPAPHPGPSSEGSSR